MASNLTTQSASGNSNPKCFICSKFFKEPKVLDCLHSFCLDCVDELKENHDADAVTLKCPLCEKETTLQDVADLPDNFTLSAEVEEAELQKQLLEGQGSEIKCQACDEGAQAISRCTDCDHFLCEECQRAHERMAVMKSHRIYTMAQYQAGEVVYKSRLREHVPKCRMHPDQNLGNYCNTCEQLVCTNCSNQDHQQHSVTGPAEALDRCKQEVAEMATKIAEKNKELTNIVAETDECRKKLDTMYAFTTKKVSTRAQEEVDSIREEESKLMEDAEKIYKDRVGTLETVHAANSHEIAQAEHKLDEVNQLMDQASCSEILHLKTKLLQNLREVQQEGRTKNMPDVSFFMDFEEGVRTSLGRLMLEEEPKLEPRPKLKTKKSFKKRLGLKEKWKLKAEITTFRSDGIKFDKLTDVAVFSDNEIVVADSGHGTLITFSQTTRPQSPVISQELQIKGLTEPSQVSVNKYDHLIVLDSPVVKVFNRKYQLLYKFTPGDGSDRRPTSLAVDDSNLIAVGYEDMEEISLHNPDGSLIRTLPAPKIGMHFTMYKKQLIYVNTNIPGRKLVAVDCNGRTAFEEDITSRFKNKACTGVCCDSYGCVYVGVNWWPSGKIYQFAPNGEYVGCLIERCVFPNSISLTPHEELVVAAGTSIQIFHRV